MSEFSDKLRADARVFLQGISDSHRDRDDIETGIERLLSWSDQRAQKLQRKQSDGPDRLVGVSRSEGGPAVWRVYPRQDGGKVCLVPGAKNHLSANSVRKIGAVLTSLNGGTPIGTGNQFDLALSRIASPDAWVKFEAALNLAFDGMASAT